MAGNIKGITIEIGGDTTKLDKAIKDTNKISRELSREIRNINTSMKFNPESFELVEQKSRATKEAIENLNEKLGVLKTAQEQANEALEKGEIGQEKYDALRREIIKTENQIKSYSGQLAKLTKEEYDSSQASKDRQSQLASLGKESDDLKTKTANLTKEYQLELQALGKNASESEKLAAKKTALGKQTELATAQVQNLQQQLALAEAEYGSNSSEVAVLEGKLLDAKIAAGELAREYQELGGVLTESSQKILNAGDTLSDFGGKLSKNVTVPILGVGAASFKLAADTEDAIGATEQIFGESAGYVGEWAKDLQSYYGVATGEAHEYVNKMGAMLKNIGRLSEEQAARTGAGLVELAGDLSAMFGGSVSEAVTALTNALKGNTTMLDNYGMGVNAATIKSKAFEMGLSDGTGELTLQAKQAATLALIMEQTADAQGQAAREADSASGAWRAFTTEIRNLSDAIGDELLPIITPMIMAITDWISKFSELDPVIKEMIVKIGLIVAAIGPLLLIIGKVLSVIGTIGGALAVVMEGAAAATPAVAGLAKVFGLVKSVAAAAIGVFGKVAAALGMSSGGLGLVILAVVAAIALLVTGIKYLIENFDKITAAAGKFVDATKAKFEQFQNFVGSLGQKITQGFANAWEGAKEKTSNGWQNIQNLVARGVNGVGRAIDGMKRFIGTVGKVWDDIKQATGNKWKQIKDAMLAPIKNAFENIKEFINKIKQLFSFELKFPSIKMPKFSVSGAFSANPPSVPKFNVDWHKDGAIFTRPTIFSTPSGLRGVGEAGAEAVLPIEKLGGIMKEAVGGTGDQFIFNVNFDEISELQDFMRMAKSAKRLKRMGVE